MYGNDISEIVRGCGCYTRVCISGEVKLCKGWVKVVYLRIFIEYVMWLISNERYIIYEYIEMKYKYNLIGNIKCYKEDNLYS